MQEVLMGERAASVLDETEQQIVIFRIGEEEFGVDIDTVSEIVRVPAITRIPKSPEHVLGLFNLRGTVVSAIDTRRKFSAEATEIDEQTRMMIVELDDRRTGLVIDAVSEVARISRKDVDETPQIATQVDQAFVDGVIKLNEGTRLILVINLFGLVQAEQRAESKRSSSAEYRAAEQHAKETIEEDQLVTFRSDGEEYAFNIQVVQEILNVPQISRLPDAPDYIKGIITVRNKLIPVVDFRHFVGAEQSNGESEKILIIENEGTAAGILVDTVEEVLRVDKKLIDRSVSLSSTAEEELSGIAKLEEGKRLIMIMNHESFFTVGNRQLITRLEGESTAIGKEEIGMNETAEEVRQLVTFILAEEQYGVPVLQVQEINRIPNITKVPKAPNFVRGVANLRGEVLPVIDLRTLFDMETKEIDDRSRIVIAEVSGIKSGIIVDKVNEVIRLRESAIEEAPELASGSAQASFVEGVARASDSGMIIILRMDKILSNQEERELAGVESPGQDD